MALPPLHDAVTWAVPEAAAATVALNVAWFSPMGIGTGVVLSSILHRDQARVYVKQIRQGESELELSPEEQEAIERALSGEPAAPAAQPE